MGLAHWLPRAQAADLLAVEAEASAASQQPASTSPEFRRGAGRGGQAESDASPLADIKALIDPDASTAAQRSGPRRRDPADAQPADTQPATPTKPQAPKTPQTQDAQAAARPIQLQGICCGPVVVLSAQQGAEQRRLVQDLAVMLGKFMPDHGRVDAKPAGLGFRWPQTTRGTGGRLSDALDAFALGLAERQGVRLLLLFGEDFEGLLPLAATASNWRATELGGLPCLVLSNPLELSLEPALKQWLWSWVQTAHRR